MKKNADICCFLNSMRKITLRRTLLSILISSYFSHSIVWANPAAPQVINGQASFSNQGNVLTITNTPGSIINWQNFSIQSGETTRFIQQNTSSSVLNRIIGQNPSQILGILQSNGRVFLINPNGIVFGQNAQVNVNGLVASTLNLTNEDFLAGRFNFTASNASGNLQNQGAITTPDGGYVYLIAPNIENSGIITSPQGNILLTAGHSVQLVDSMNPDLHVVISAPEDSTINVGQIIAQGGKIGIYGALIHQSSMVSANSAVVDKNGKIVFKASQDAILDDGSQTTATGEGNGGEIHILGNRIGLAGHALINASGKTAGGTVLVGGDYHGENPDIQNASRTYIDQNATIKADATQNGDGGKIIVWSNDITRVYGTLSARGGEQGGAGGFVETSSQQNLDYQAKVDVRAPAGQNGTLVLDPNIITLVGGTGDGSSSSDGTSFFQGSSIPGTVNFSDNDLTSPGVSKIFQSELEGIYPGTNILLEATDYINTTGSFSNKVTLPMNSSLTMHTRNASTDGNGQIGINLTSSADGSNLEFQTQGTGFITLQTGLGSSPQAAAINVGKLTTNGGQVTVKATGDISVGSVTTTPATTQPGGNIIIDSSGGNLALNGTIDARGNASNAGNVILASAGEIALQNTATLYADQLKISAANGIHGSTDSDDLNTQINTLNASNTNAGSIRIHNSAPNPLAISDIGASGYGIQQMATNQNLFISSTNGIGINATIITQGGNININGSSGLALSPSSLILTNGGSANLYTTNANAMISMAANSIIKSDAGPITLQADKMALHGTIDANNGSVNLRPLSSTAIHLGTVDTDTTASTLELSNTELNTITANTLRIGDTGSGSIDIKSPLISAPGEALEHISNTLNLRSAGTITQQANAVIALPSVTATGASVILTEANPTGVISGGSTLGDFLYRSANALSITQIDGITGITAPATANIGLISDSTYGIHQTTGSPINAPGASLVLRTIGSVSLMDRGNTVGKLTADLNVNSSGTGTLEFYNADNLDISGPYSSIQGITTYNQNITLTTGSGKTLAITQPINAGTAEALLEGDSLSLNNSVTANIVGIRPATTGRNITVGSTTCFSNPCLNITQLYQINAPTIGIGTDGNQLTSGDIYVAGITDSNNNAITDIRHGVTTRLGLLTGGSITQGGTITVQDFGVSAGNTVNLNLNNTISNFVGRSGGDLTLVNSTGLNVTTVSGGTPPLDYNISGILSKNGNISLTTNTGNIVVSAPINTSTGSIALTASKGAISQNNGGGIFGSSLIATAANGIGSDAALLTKVGTLTAANSGTNTDINITNSGPLTLQNITQSASGGSGNITINNQGTLTLAAGGTLSTKTGNIHLKSDNALTIGGTIFSTSGAINLEAGAPNSALSSSNNTASFAASTSTSTSTSGDINLAAAINAGTGDITLTANGGAISQSGGTISGSNLNMTASHGIGNDTPLSTQISSLAATNSDMNTDINIANTGTLTLQNVAQSTSGSSGNITVKNKGALTVAAGKTVSTDSGAIRLKSDNALTINGNTISTSGGAISLEAGTTGNTTDTLTINGSIDTSNTSGVAVATTGSILLKAGDAITVNGHINGNVTQQSYLNLPTLDQCIANPSLSGCSSVLPTLTQCTQTPTLKGCSVVVPSSTQTSATTSSVVQAINSTSTTTSSTTTNTVTQPVATPATSSSSENTSSSASESSSSSNTQQNTSNTDTGTETGSSDTNTQSDKKDQASDTKKKDAKKDTTETKDSGAKKNDVAKKMYCN